MGPQVKIGTHSVRQGTPSVPVAAAALARGEPLSPSPTGPTTHPSHPPSHRPPSIRPSHPLSSHSPSLIYRAESPRNAPTQPPSAPPSPTPFSPSLLLSFHPVTNSSLPRLPRPALNLPPALTPLASHSPPPISHPCALRLQSITRSRRAVANLLNYHTFAMIPARTRDTVLIAGP